jgi:sec-independent protein translocase protein TatA
MPGVQELLVIFLIVVVLFGATRLPQLGKGLGEGIRNFKDGLKSKDDDPHQLEDGRGEDNRPIRPK